MLRTEGLVVLLHEHAHEMKDFLPHIPVTSDGRVLQQLVAARRHQTWECVRKEGVYIPNYDNNKYMYIGTLSYNYVYAVCLQWYH